MLLPPPPPPPPQYGTVPLVASTGGLVDTVKEGVTGFQMGAMDPDRLADSDAGAWLGWGAVEALVAADVGGSETWWLRPLHAHDAMESAPSECQLKAQA